MSWAFILLLLIRLNPVLSCLVLSRAALGFGPFFLLLDPLTIDHWHLALGIDI